MLGSTRPVVPSLANLPREVLGNRRIERWLKENEMSVQTGQGKFYSHTSLRGGLFDITSIDHWLTRRNINRDSLSEADLQSLLECQEQRFLDAYAQAIFDTRRDRRLQDGRKRPGSKFQYPFLSEAATPVFRLFMDLDFESTPQAPDGYASRTVLSRRIAAKKRCRDYYQVSGVFAEERVESDKLLVYTRQLEQTKHEELFTLVAEIQATVKRFFPKADAEERKVFVCLTAPKVTESGHKDGVHLIWPNLFVTSEQALYVRQNALFAIEKRFGSRPETANDWADVLDEEVYREGATCLRMLGSRKAELCKKCLRWRRAKQKESAVDPNTGKPWWCNPSCREQTSSGLRCRQGHFFNSRVYWPEYLLDGDGNHLGNELQRLLDPRHETVPGEPDKYFYLMRQTCVRAPFVKTSESWELPARCEAPIQRTKSRKRSAAGASDVGHEQDAKGLQKYRAREPLDPDHPWRPFLKRLIVHSFGDKFVDVELAAVFLLRKKDAGQWGHQTYLITVRGPGSNYCLNKGDDHNSNTVYFMVQPTGIVQKCHCEKSEVRRSGKSCQDYTSKEHRLDDFPTLATLMFPPFFDGGADSHPAFKREHLAIARGERKQPEGMPVSQLIVIRTRRLFRAPRCIIKTQDPTMTQETLKHLEAEFVAVESATQADASLVRQRSAPKAKGGGRRSRYAVMQRSQVRVNDQ